MKTTIRNLYGFSQELLYTLCVLFWNVCKQYLNDFTTVKPFYTDTYVDDAIKVVENAKKLPTSRQAISTRKADRVKLIEANTQIREDWQMLKTYIKKAFPKNLWTIKLQAAGSALYAKGAQNLSAVREMTGEAITFITENESDLKANNNMPGTFPQQFRDNGKASNDAWTAFAQSDNAKKFAVKNKLEANNALYEALVELVGDAQQVFRNNLKVRQLFVIETMLKSIKGGSAGMRGTVKDTLGNPLAGVLIKTQDGAYETITDSKGHYKFTRMQFGKYILMLEKEGENPLTVEVTLEPKTTHNADFTMSQALKAVA